MMLFGFGYVKGLLEWRYPRQERLLRTSVCVDYVNVAVLCNVLRCMYVRVVRSRCLDEGGTGGRMEKWEGSAVSKNHAGTVK